MKAFDLFNEHNVAQATKILATIERYAECRNRFIDCLDFDALDDTTQREICMRDHYLEEQRMFGPLYLHHLNTLDTQRAAIAASIPLAA